MFAVAGPVEDHSRREKLNDILNEMRSLLSIPRHTLIKSDTATKNFIDLLLPEYGYDRNIFTKYASGTPDILRLISEFEEKKDDDDSRSIEDFILETTLDGYININHPFLQDILYNIQYKYYKKYFIERPLYRHLVTHFKSMSRQEFNNEFKSIYVARMLGLDIYHRQVILYMHTFFSIYYIEYLMDDINANSRICRLMVYFCFLGNYPCLEESHDYSAKQDSYTPHRIVNFVRIMLKGVTLDVCSNPISHKSIQSLVYFSKYCSGLGIIFTYIFCI